MLSYNAAHAAATKALGVGCIVIIQMPLDIKHTSVNSQRRAGHWVSALGPWFR